MHRLCLSFALLALVGAKAQAAGFEKSVMWSGKYAGSAGAGAVSGVTGSQSVFFNPAGLAKNGDASVNFSPTWIHVNGYFASTTSKEDTDRDYITSGDLSASYVLNDRFGFGVAAYAIGGERAVYENVSFTGDQPATGAFTPTIKTDLAITEYALGAGTEVIPGLRFGAAWRISRAKGSLATVKKIPAATAYVYTDFEDAQDTRYNGYKVGLQYEDPASHDWGVGATYRNGVAFNAATTNTSGRVFRFNGTEPAGATVSATTLSLTLPAQGAFGAWYRATDNLKVMAGFDVTKYSVDQFVLVNGTITSASLGGTVNLPGLPLNWGDMWNFRVGGEYTLSSVALRAGYSHTNRVTSTTDARAIIAPAGTGHMLTVGAGTSLMKNLDLDGALEYAWNHGNGSQSANQAGVASQEILAGTATDTNARSMAVHTGVTYRF